MLALPIYSVHYSLGAGTVSDIATYYLDLANGGNNPGWVLEYRFSAAYGYDAFTAENLEALAATIHN